jgi:hypothetical protein
MTYKTNALPVANKAKTITYQRNLTKEEIKFGYGTIHCIFNVNSKKGVIHTDDPFSICLNQQFKNCLYNSYSSPSDGISIL